MKTYDIKLELTQWHDKNYEIKADSKEEAQAIAISYAKKDMKGFYLTDLLADDGDVWTYGSMELNEVYVEEVHDS